MTLIFLVLTIKATGFKSLLVNYREINQVTSKCQMDFFGHNLQKRSKTEYRHRILRFQNGLGTKFQVKQTILDQINSEKGISDSKKKNKWKTPSNSTYLK